MYTPGEKNPGGGGGFGVARLFSSVTRLFISVVRALISVARAFNAVARAFKATYCSWESWASLCLRPGMSGSSSLRIGLWLRRLCCSSCSSLSLFCISSCWRVASFSNSCWSASRLRNSVSFTTSVDSEEKMKGGKDFFSSIVVLLSTKTRTQQGLNKDKDLTRTMGLTMTNSRTKWQGQGLNKDSTRTRTQQGLWFWLWLILGLNDKDKNKDKDSTRTKVLRLNDIRRGMIMIVPGDCQ